MVLSVMKPFMHSSTSFHMSTRFRQQSQARNLALSVKHLSEVLPYKNDSKALSRVKTKFNEIVTWYENFTGLDEVRLAQNRVLEAEEKFIRAQEKRRECTVALSEVNNKLKELYAELDNTSRGEDKYVFLITQEHKLLKQEKAIQVSKFIYFFWKSLSII